MPTFCEWLLVPFGSGPVLRKLGPGSHIVNKEETYHLTADFQHQAVAFVLSLTVDPELRLCPGFDPESAFWKLKRHPRPLSFSLEKTEPCPRRSSAYRDVFSFVCLFDFSERADNGSARHRLLFVRAVGFAHVFSRDVRSEGRLSLELQVSLPQFKKLRRCSPLINSRTPAPHTVARHSAAIYNPPSLQFGFKKSDVTEKQVAGRFDGAARFFQRDKSTEDHHNAACPTSKRLSYLGTSVLMMYNMEDD